MFSKKKFGIASNLRFISMRNFMLSWVEHEKSFITSGSESADFEHVWRHIFAWPYRFNDTWTCFQAVTYFIFQFPDQPLGSSFLSEHLNRLIYKLSGIRNFIQPYELSMCSTGMYTVDPNVAERRVCMEWSGYFQIACTLLTQTIESPSLFTILVPKFKQIHFTTCWCVLTLLDEWQTV